MLAHTEDKYLKDLSPVWWKRKEGREGGREGGKKKCFNLHFSDYLWGSSLFCLFAFHISSVTYRLEFVADFFHLMVMCSY